MELFATPKWVDAFHRAYKNSSLIPWPQLRNEVLAERNPDRYIRSFTKNRLYGVKNDRRIVISGIFVINKNFPSPHGYPVDFPPIKPINATMEDFMVDYESQTKGELRSQNVVSLEDFRHFHKRNLLNV
jgi:hypothetical protein